MNLEKKTSEWVKAGFLTAENQKKILTAEQKEGKNVFSLVFLLIGALCVGVGIIALIASNWWKIPNVVKLVFDFMLLAGASGITFYAWKKERPILFEVMLFFLSLLTLASIGLIAQVYHLYSGWYHGVLFWGFITLPLAILSRKMFLFLIMIPAISTAFFCKIATYPWFRTLGELIGSNISPLIGIPVSFLSLAFVIGLVRFIFRGRGRTFVVPLFFWKTFSAIFAVAVTDFLFFISGSSYFFRTYYPKNPDSVFVTLFYLVATLFIIGTFLLWGFNNRVSKEQRKVFYVMEGIFALLLFISAFAHPSGVALRLFVVLMALGFLFAGAFFSFFQNKRKLFYFFGTLIGIRFILVYFEVFQSILFTGWVLILSGVLIIVSVVFGVKILKFFTSLLPAKAKKGAAK